MNRQERIVKFRLGLSALYLPIYDKLWTDPTLENWAPYYGLRTVEEQDALYAQGRTTPGPKVTNAVGGQSPHQYGCACDGTKLGDDGQPIWTFPDSDWQIYFMAIQNAGAKSGKSWGDPDHNELHIGVSWADVNRIRVALGMDAALSYIGTHVV